MKTRERRNVTLLAIFLVGVQALLLAWIATVNSPVLDEPANLASGLSHWKELHFELYRVNPPLVRMVATFPLLFTSVNTDCLLEYPQLPYSRPEFVVARHFMRDNGAAVFPYFTVARWCCIPFTLIGGWIAFLWARELYGPSAGLASLILYVSCPNI